MRSCDSRRRASPPAGGGRTRSWRQDIYPVPRWHTRPPDGKHMPETVSYCMSCCGSPHVVRPNLPLELVFNQPSTHLCTVSGITSRLRWNSYAFRGVRPSPVHGHSAATIDRQYHTGCGGSQMPVRLNRQLEKMVCRRLIVRCNRASSISSVSSCLDIAPL